MSYYSLRSIMQRLQWAQHMEKSREQCLEHGPEIGTFSRRCTLKKNHKGKHNFPKK